MDTRSARFLLRTALHRARLALGRYPVVRQYDRADCGPAALLSVLRYHGGDASFPGVRDLVGTGMTGSSLLQLARAAAELGFEAEGAEGTYEQLQAVAHPCLAHVESRNGGHHYVVVFRATPRFVIVGDPARGRQRLPRPRFEEMWRSRVVLLLQPGPGLRRTPTLPWTRWIGAHIRRHGVWFVQSVFVGLLYTAFGLATAFFVQRLIDRAVPRGDVRELIGIGLSLAAIMVGRAALTLLRLRFTADLDRRVGYDIASEFISHLLRLPERFFASRRAGDVIARLQDGMSVQSAASRTAAATIIDVSLVAGTILVMFAFVPAVGWLSLGALPAYAAFIVWLSRRFHAMQRSTLDAYGQLEAAYVETVRGMRDVRTFNAAAWFEAMILNSARRSLDCAKRLGYTVGSAGALSELLGGLLLIAGLLIGARLAMDEHRTVGEMMAAYSLLATLVPAIHRIVDSAVSLQGASASAERLRDLLLSPAETDTGRAPSHPLTAIAIRAGAFHWPSGEPCFHRIDLEIAPGRLCALTGPIGAGKSTLVRILQRDLSLTGGALLADGTPAHEYPLGAYRRAVAVHRDDVAIFRGTIGDNLCMGRPAVARAQLPDRLREFHLDGFFARYPAGLHTPIGEDGRLLSAGERQVLGLARALLGDPAVLLIDEGLNAVDAETLEHIVYVLHAYAQRHAVLLISHSRELLQRADVRFDLTRDGIIAPTQFAEAMACT